MKYHISPLVLVLQLCMLTIFSVQANTQVDINNLQSQNTLLLKGLADGFLGPDETICEGDTVRISAPLAFSYVWSTGQTSQFIDVHPAATTDYWVRVINLQGQTESDTLKVIVNPLPDVLISPAYTELLPGEAVLLTATGALTYVWSNNETGNQLFVTPVLPENPYSVTGTSSLGCTSIATAQVDVRYTTLPAFEYTKTCLGDTTYFQSKIITNDTIQLIEWDLDSDLMFDDGLGTNQKFFFEQPGEWLVGIKVTTKYSAEAHIEYFPVMVGDIPVLSYTYASSCVSTPIRFTGKAVFSVGQIESWAWDFGNEQLSSDPEPVVTFTTTATQLITLKVTTSAGCEAEYSGNFAASPRPALTVSYADGSLIAQLPLTMYRNDTIRLRANGVYDSIKWNQTIESVTLNVVRPGTYTAVSYRDGCVSQPVSIGVVMNDFPYDPNLKIQNILTPNGDGYNDVWEISMLNAISPARVFIYTRSGMSVISDGDSNNYKNNWNGQFNGNPLPEGSYFYIIEGAGGEVFKGAITLIR